MDDLPADSPIRKQIEDFLANGIPLQLFTGLDSAFSRAYEEQNGGTASIPCTVKFVDEDDKPFKKQPNGGRECIKDYETWLVHAGDAERITIPRSEMVFLDPDGNMLEINTSIDNLKHCLVCNSDKRVRKCSKCKTVAYCSKKCQSLDWKFHKKNCDTGVKFEGAWAPQVRAKPDEPGKSGLMGLAFKTPYPDVKPNTIKEADSLKFLKDLPKKEVFKRIIDAYRLHCYEAYMNNGTKKGIFKSPEDVLTYFTTFLWHVNRLTDILPPWWNFLTGVEFIPFATDEKSWWYIGHAVRNVEIRRMYKGSAVIWQLKAFNKKVEELSAKLTDEGFPTLSKKELKKVEEFSSKLAGEIQNIIQTKK